MKRLLMTLTLIFILCLSAFTLTACQAPHVHTFDQEVVAEDFLASEATCEDKAEYYYSCTCGVKDEAHTFESGTALGHAYGAWISIGNGQHKKTCANDNSHTIIETCSGGNATCTKLAECSVCGEEYGELEAHDYVTLKHSETEHWYECVCGEKSGIEDHDYAILKHDETEHWYECECGAYETKENHKDGNATCTKLAECSVCGEEYGELEAHDYATLKHNETEHWYECVCGDKDGIEAHKDGNATCTKLAECSVCGEEYGELEAHDYATLKHNEMEHWYECVCGDKDGIEAHKDGNPTCTKLAECSACGEEYGEFGKHKISSVWNCLNIKYDSEAFKIDGNTFEFVNYFMNYIDYTTTIKIHVKENISLKINYKMQGGTSRDYLIFRHNGTEVLRKLSIREWTVFSINLNAGDVFLIEYEKDGMVFGADDEKFWVEFIGDEIEYSNSTHLTPLCEEDIKCLTCEEILIAKTGHIFQEEVINSDYLYSSASCTARARYNYSCRCGEKGTETFEYGELEEHTYATEYVYDETHHWQQATCGCDLKQNFNAHEVDASGFCTVCEMPINPTAGVLYDYSLDGTYIEVIGYEGASTKVKIAETYDSLPVKSIYSEVFKGKNITSVIIPESVTTIDEKAFYGCNKLKTVIFEGDTKLESIGEYAFYNCSSLTSLTLGENVTNIGSYAFYNCSSLTSITISDSVTSIGSDAFYNCTSLTKVNYLGTIDEWVEIGFANSYSNPLRYGKNLYINDELVTNVALTTATKINNSAFYNCSSLTEVIIPDSATSIGSDAFYNCTSLTKVNYLGTIDEWVEIEFSNSYSNPLRYAKNLYINDELVTNVVLTIATKINSYAFSGCSSLTSIEIPSSVTSIGGDAFYGCISLTSIEIPDSVTRIGIGAFSGCSSLENITIPFVGEKAGVTSSDRYKYPFGYIFGTSSYDGGVATKQNYLVYSTGGNTSYSSTFYMPSSLKSVTITGGNILYGAFSNCSSLTEVIIPDSVTSIGSDAFYNCSKLTSVVIPNSVTSIGYDAFYNCSKLFLDENNVRYVNINENPYYLVYGVTSTNFSTYKINSSAVIICRSSFAGLERMRTIEIPDSLTSIGDSAFKNCSSLTEVIIGDSVTSIGGDAFAGCPIEKATIPTTAISSIPKGALKEVIITSGESIDYRAFYNCSSLTEVTIGDSVTSIGYDAFEDCSSLTSVTIGDSVTSIGSYAFRDCSSLTEVTIGDSVTSIGSQAFNNCSSLKTIEIPSSVTSIGYDAFKNCSSLTEVIIGDSVISIGDSAFSGCSSLTSITIPNSVTSIGDSAFYNCSSLEYNIDGNLKYLGNSSNPYLYLADTRSEVIDSATISSSCKIIGYSAFEDCDSLTSITIPNSVTSIGYMSFNSCNSLTSVTIGDSVTSIGDYAFSGCSKLTSITISDSVTSIGDSAFKNCPIEKATIPTTAISSIPKGALKEVIITSGESIGSYAFHNCSKLTSVVIPNSVTSIGSSAFSGCSKLTSVVIPNSVTSIGSSAFYDCGSLTSITIPNSVTSIGSSAFYDCDSLTSITIPNSVTSIGYNAFYNCSSLKYNIDGDLKYLGNSSNPYLYLADTRSEFIDSATISSSCKFIGYDAFRGCYLTSVTIGDSVRTIYDSAFYNCDNLTSVTFGENSQLTSIGSQAFYNCSSLKTIEIPSSVTSIGDSAFYNCSSLEYNIDGDLKYLGNSSNPYLYLADTRSEFIDSATISSSCKFIGYSAFEDCDSLTSITIPNSVTSIGSGAFYNCTSLTKVNYLGTIDEWVQIEFSNSYSNPLRYAKNLYINDELVTDVALTTATLVSGYAFYNCSSLTNIEIPDSVTSIGNNAFAGCPIEKAIIPTTAISNIPEGALKEVIITSGESIGYDAFSGCSKLTSVVIPNSVTSIGDYAFYDCSSLTNVYYGGTAEDWADITIGFSSSVPATRYYYIENESDLPADSGNYWHYVDGIPTVWTKE